jgi:hypothetical protein
VPEIALRHSEAEVQNFLAQRTPTFLIATPAISAGRLKAR